MTSSSMSVVTLYAHSWDENNRLSGIPRAPINFDGVPKLSPDTVRFIINLRKKVDAQQRLPWMSTDAVMNKQHKYHIVKLQQLMVLGKFDVAQQVQALIRFDEKVQRGWSWTGNFVTDDDKKIDMIITALTETHRLIEAGHMLAACGQLKGLAEQFLKEREPWLAIYLFHACLTATEQLEDDTNKAQLQAELHVLLAFLEKPKNERLLTLQQKEKYLETSIGHLAMTRHLSKNHHTWKIEPNLIHIGIPTSVNVHGLGNEQLEIEGHAEPLYMLATILEHDLLIGLAEATVNLHDSTSLEDYEAACSYAYEAMKLAFEVLNPVAISAAILRCGLLQFHCHKFDEALVLFIQMLEYSELRTDPSSTAIALQNIGRCLMQKSSPIRAMEFFAQEKELAEQEELKELEADCVTEMGEALLEQGHLWEAEECFLHSYETFTNSELEDRENEALVFASITAGQNLYSRLAGLARADNSACTMAIHDWKTTRKALPTVSRPNYDLYEIEDLYRDEKHIMHVKPLCKLSVSESTFLQQMEEENTDGLGEEVDHDEDEDNKRKKRKSKSKSPKRMQFKKWGGKSERTGNPKGKQDTKVERY